MKILYGKNDNVIDISNLFKDIIVIPKNDNKRASLFGDPIYGVLKVIIITDDFNKTRTLDHTEEIILLPDGNGKFNLDLPVNWEFIYSLNISDEDKLKVLHQLLILNFGSFQEEYQEQLMAMKFIKPTDVVLELGGNIGRNSCIIGSILNDSKNLLVLETISEYANKLNINRLNNNLKFNIENSALSKRRLIQNEWDTKPSEINENGWTVVNTITFDKLISKYNMHFNTIVADCEGALYYILKDEPKVLHNINTIIIENDFKDINHKIFVDEEFRKNGFERVYVEKLNDKILFPYTRDFFYEVWQKN